MTSEQQARETIDALLTRAGWVVRNADEANIHAHRGVAIRDKSAGEPIWTPAGRPKGRGTGMDRDQSPLKQGHGFADYLLYVDGQAAGVIEAKKEGATLTGVEIQSGKYAAGLPDGLPAWSKPLPFSYQSTGTDKSVGKPIWTPARCPKGSGSEKSRYQTRFTNGLDPEPRFRPVFAFHRPETLAEWLEPPQSNVGWVKRSGPTKHVADATPAYLENGAAAPGHPWPCGISASMPEIFPGREWVPKTLIFAKGEAEKGERPVDVRPAERASHGRPALGFRAKRDARAKKEKPTVSFEKLMQAVAFCNTEDDVLTSLAGRLARMEYRLTHEEAINAARMQRSEIR